MKLSWRGRVHTGHGNPVVTEEKLRPRVSGGAG